MSFPRSPQTVPVGSNNNDDMVTMNTSVQSSSSSGKNKTKDTKYHVGDMDVICGRGKAGFNHPGNIRFRTAVMQAIEDYQHAEDRIGKPIIVRAIISNTYSTGGCFVRRDLKREAAWIELNFQEQKDKVRHALRDAIAELKIKKMKAAVECIRMEQPLSSTNEGQSGESFKGATISNLAVESDPFSIMSVLSEKSTLTTAVAIQGNLDAPTSTFSSLIAFPNQPILQHTLQLYDTTKPSSLKGPSISRGYSVGGPMTGMDDDSSRSIRSAAVALQLAAQVQLVQMNSRNNMYQSFAFQLYQHIQKERQLQNVQNCVCNMNAMKLALQQRDYINLKACLANLQNFAGN